MNITVLHGQIHKGSTYNITKLFLDKLISVSDEHIKVDEFSFPRDMSSSCIGCFNCFNKGEEHCPHSGSVQAIVKSLEEADLIIMESPCYVFGMSGQLKCFLDHMGYRWMAHRPHPKMFHKLGLVISTSAGAGDKKVNKSLKENLMFWGVPKIYSYGKAVAASSWETVNDKKKQRIEKDLMEMANKISKKVCRTKAGIKTRILFYIMRLSQKANNWNKVDKEHWINNGWLGKQRPW